MGVERSTTIIFEATFTMLVGYSRLRYCYCTCKNGLDKIRDVRTVMKENYNYG